MRALKRHWQASLNEVSKVDTPSILKGNNTNTNLDEHTEVGEKTGRRFTKIIAVFAMSTPFLVTPDRLFKQGHGK